VGLHRLFFFENVIQVLSNLCQALVFPLIDDIPDVLAEPQVVFRILEEKAIYFLHIVMKLVILPRDVKSRLCTVHSNTKYCTVDKLDLFLS
jgi:hypothetical protein